MVLPLAFGWRHLLFANWAVDADLLETHLPDALSVQEYDGDGWLSVVPFLNVHTRPRGLPARLGVRLPELNLRTYVTCDGEQGVYFFSLDANGLAGVLGARLLHHLAYYYARMRLEWDDRCRRRRMRFASRRLHPGDRPVRFEATYGPDGEPLAPDPGSRAAFPTDRNRLYTRGTDGGSATWTSSTDPGRRIRQRSQSRRTRYSRRTGLTTPRTNRCVTTAPAWTWSRPGASGGIERTPRE